MISSGLQGLWGLFFAENRHQQMIRNGNLKGRYSKNKEGKMVFSSDAPLITGCDRYNIQHKILFTLHN
jgi:hypothetical protein